MKDLRGRVAVVTGAGAGSGIGLRLAEQLAEEGMAVVIADIDEAALEQARLHLEGFGADVCAVPTDVSVESSVNELERRAVERFGKVHVLVNNAGVFARGNVWEISLED